MHLFVGHALVVLEVNATRGAVSFASLSQLEPTALFERHRCSRPPYTCGHGDFVRRLWMSGGSRDSGGAV